MKDNKKDKLISVLEAALFIQGEEGLTKKEISKLLK